MDPGWIGISQKGAEIDGIVNLAHHPSINDQIPLLLLFNIKKKNLNYDRKNSESNPIGTQKLIFHSLFINQIG